MVNHSLRHDATLTKTRSDACRPMDAFRSIIDAKLLNRASSMTCCSTGFASPYKHTWRVLVAVCALTRLEGFASPYKHIRYEFIGAELAETTSYSPEQNLPRWLYTNQRKAEDLVGVATEEILDNYARGRFPVIVHVKYGFTPHCRGQTNLCTRLLFADWRTLHWWSPEDTSD
jgi:hypothetical protein